MRVVAIVVIAVTLAVATVLTGRSGEGYRIERGIDKGRGDSSDDEHIDWEDRKFKDIPGEGDHRFDPIGGVGGLGWT